MQEIKSHKYKHKTSVKPTQKFKKKRFDVTLDIRQGFIAVPV